MTPDSAAHPLTPEQAYNGAYWRERSAMFRDRACMAGAASMTDLLRVAEECDRLAARADEVRAAAERL